MNLPTTKPNDRDIAWYIRECEDLRNRLESLAASNKKQTDDYVCVDREHGLYRRTSHARDAVSADRLALALSLKTLDELERENAVLRTYSDDMTDQFFAVSQENAALRDDKKLVDWLEENEASAVFEPGDPEVGLFPAWSVYYNDRELPVVHIDLRAAINAARAKKGGAS
jgi:hypothetical protein